MFYKFGSYTLSFSHTQTHTVHDCKAQKSQKLWQLPSATDHNASEQMLQVKTGLRQNSKLTAGVTRAFYGASVHL